MVKTKKKRVRRVTLYVVPAYSGEKGKYNIVDYNRSVYEYGNKKTIKKFMKENKDKYIFKI